MLSHSTSGWSREPHRSSSLVIFEYWLAHSLLDKVDLFLPAKAILNTSICCWSCFNKESLYNSTNSACVSINPSWTAVEGQKAQPLWSSIIRSLRKVRSSAHISSFNSLNFFPEFLFPLFPQERGSHLKNTHLCLSTDTVERPSENSSVRCSWTLGNNFYVWVVKHQIQGVKPRVSPFWWRTSVGSQSQRTTCFLNMFRFYMYLVPSFVFLT